MSFVPLGKPKRPRGRPIGAFNRKRETSITAMRITQDLKDLLDCEKRKGETYAETNLRLLKERTDKLGEYRKKAEALEQELVYYEQESQINDRYFEEIKRSIF